MTCMTDLLDQGDYCSLIVVIAILCLVGSRMAQPQPTAYVWGFRIAAAVFILFGIARVSELQSPAAEDLLWAVVSALFAAGLSLGPAWILLTVACYASSSVDRARARRRSTREQEERDRQSEIHRRQREEQDRERRLADQERERRLADADARRREARASLRRAFYKHQSKLVAHFSEDQLRDYLESHMSDKHAPADVERNAKELIRVFENLVKDIEPPRDMNAMKDRIQKFRDQKRAFESSDIPEDVRKILLVELEQEFEEVLLRLIREH